MFALGVGIKGLGEKYVDVRACPAAFWLSWSRCSQDWRTESISVGRIHACDCFSPNMPCFFSSPSFAFRFPIVLGPAGRESQRHRQLIERASGLHGGLEDVVAAMPIKAMKRRLEELGANPLRLGTCLEKVRPRSSFYRWSGAPRRISLPRHAPVIY